VNPLSLVREWFEEAAASGIIEAERMALATATPDGRPSVRIVLLKGIDDEGIQFFTNYGSRKGRELDANPRAAVTFYWQPLQRAARLEGRVEKLTAAESDAYFASRPRGAQVGAWASAQGSVLRDRAELEARGLLGRLPAAARRDRVVAGPRRPPARPRALPAAGRRQLADRAALAVVLRGIVGRNRDPSGGGCRTKGGTTCHEHV
jgi:pyridoxamine-phosphate oxidase